MPRRPRIMSSTGIYHIILRSVNQHLIFEEDSDYQKFIYILSDCKMKYDIKIYAYCLMDNHIHLLLNSPSDELPSFFQSLGAKFVKWYNNKYLRTGHLFQDRYRSTTIENERSFLAALVYIHDNPVKANICRYPSEYRWSSYNVYYGQKSALIDTDLADSIAGSRHELHKFFSKESGPAEDELFADDHKKQKLFFTDEKALDLFLSTSKLSSTSEVNNLDKTQRNRLVFKLRNLGLTVKQVARLMDISETTVKRLSKMVPNPRP